MHPGSPVVPDSSDPPELPGPELVPLLSEVSPVSVVDGLVDDIDADAVDGDVVVAGSIVVDPEPDSVSPSPLGAVSSPQPHSHNDITTIDQGFICHAG
jgi:hypothetical protein